MRIRISVAGTTVLAALIAAALLLAPGKSGALETNGGCPAPGNIISKSHETANVPHVFVIGDSISADADTRAIYGDVLWRLHDWRSTVVARGGATIAQHRCLNWLSFYWAARSNARAVVVELGTNDVSGINESMSPAQALTEFSRVFNEVNWATKYLRDQGKCVVWVGLNERFDGTIFGLKYVDRDAARAFDNHVKDRASAIGPLHYADYTALIDQNATFRNSLAGPGDRVHPTYNGKWELVKWIGRRVDANCI